VTQHLTQTLPPLIHSFIALKQERPKAKKFYRPENEIRKTTKQAKVAQMGSPVVSSFMNVVRTTTLPGFASMPDDAKD
jgi:hypothetical protein